MLKKGKRFLLLLLTMTLTLALLAGTALAKSDDVATSDTLEIWVKDGSGNSQQIATYNMDDMEVIGLEEYYYASIDNLPAPVLTIACGVLLDDLIADIEEEYPQTVGWKSITFTSTDSWSKRYTASAFSGLSSSRYYYPALLDEGALDADGIVITTDPEAGRESVPALLAFYSCQERIGAAGVDIASVEDDYAAALAGEDNSDSFRLCLGMTASQLSNSSRITSDFGRGICKLEFTMPATATTVAATGLAAINPAGGTIKVNATLQLTAKVQPDNASNTTVTWESSDNSIAKVNASGLVSGVSAGTATITATAADGGFSKSCVITVTAANIPVGGVSLSKSSAGLTVGGSLTLNAIITPANASNTAINWSSSNNAVAKVNNGTISGVKAGTATITATTLDGAHSASCQITVSSQAVAVTGVSIRSSLTMAVNGEKQLSADLEPAAATNTQVYWSSSAPGVVRVDTDGLLTAKAEGEAVITVSTEDGGYTAKCKVTVLAEQKASLDNFQLADKAVPFSDVAAISGDWVYEGVSRAYRLGLMIGSSSTTFNPLGDYKISEALMTAARLHDIYNGGDGVIDQPSVWYMGAVDYCVDNDIIQAGDFNGNYTRNITRAEMAYVFAGALPADELEPINRVASLPDVGERDAHAANIFLLYRAGVLTGNDSLGTFYPNKEISRREVAAIVSRMALPDSRRALSF